jgi:hypothetical protein
MVKCIDCGYLATRNKQTRELMEVEFDFRYTDEFVNTANMLQIYDYPVCFLQEADLQRELDISNPSISKIQESLLNVIQTERPCKFFTK